MMKSCLRFVDRWHRYYVSEYKPLETEADMFRVARPLAPLRWSAIVPIVGALFYASGTWAMQLAAPRVESQQRITREPISRPSRQTPALPPGQQRDLALARITEKWTGDLDGMIHRRYVRVATTYNDTNYFIDKGVQRGTVYESMKLFENELNAKLKSKHVYVVFIPMSRDSLLPALVEGRADVAAAALTVTAERQKLVDFSQPTRAGIDEIVVTGPGAPNVASLEDLSGHEVFVRKSSTYYENLASLNAQLKSKGNKEVTLKPAPETLEDDDLLEMVNAGLAKITVVDNYMAEFWKQLLPNLVLHPEVAVAKGSVLGIAMRKNSPQLMAAANGWIRKHGPKTVFGNMMTQRYLKNTQFAKSATSSAGLARFQQTVELFRKYGGQYEIDYLLMMAQGFQESGLDQNVKSPVGAIGVMQVMPETGKKLAVGDVRKVEANIHAGVKYIRLMMNTYFENQPMDRFNKAVFTFAAYNAGPNRIRQLQREASKRGLDSNIWFDNVERIASERIGRETVTYVRNIYKYYIAYVLVMDDTEQRSRPRQLELGNELASMDRVAPSCVVPPIAESSIRLAAAAPPAAMLGTSWSLGPVGRVRHLPASRKCSTQQPNSRWRVSARNGSTRLTCRTWSRCRVSD
jgi:membrane-bound lytic murein transglycosylase MltF